MDMSWGWKPVERSLPYPLALVTDEDGAFFQLRYDSFVLFDTGDLDQVADELVQSLREAAVEK